MRASADDVLEYHRKTVNKSEEALADDGGAAAGVVWAKVSKLLGVSEGHGVCCFQFQKNKNGPKLERCRASAEKGNELAA